MSIEELIEAITVKITNINAEEESDVTRCFENMTRVETLEWVLGLMK